MKIETDGLTGSEVIGLLRLHRAEMERVTPQAESMHALDLDGLRRPARALYEPCGFEYCDPIADYAPDPLMSS